MQRKFGLYFIANYIQNTEKNDSQKDKCWRIISSIQQVHCIGHTSNNDFEGSIWPAPALWDPVDARL